MEEDENIRGSFSDAAFMTTGLLMIIAGSLPLPMSGWRGRCSEAQKPSQRVSIANRKIFACPENFCAYDIKGHNFVSILSGRF